MQATFNQPTEGSTILARPYFNVTTGTQASSLIANPGTSSGGIAIGDSSYFNAAGVHLIRTVSYDRTANGGVRRVEGIVGFRYFGLYENLQVDTFTSAPGTVTSTYDRFRTSDTFYGGSFGLMSSRYSGRWSLITIGRLGVGDTTQHLHIAGGTTTSTLGSVQATPGGLLALPSNQGDFFRDFFSLVPVELKLGFALTPNLPPRSATTRCTGAT